MILAGNDSQSWTVLSTVIESGESKVYNPPVRNLEKLTAATATNDVVYVGTQTGELIAFELKRFRETATISLGQNVQILQIEALAELKKVVTLSSAAAQGGLPPMFFQPALASTLQVHRSDTLAVMCSVQVNATRLFLTRTGFGADIALLQNNSVLTRAKYEEKLSGKSTMFTLNVDPQATYTPNASINSMGRNHLIMTIAASDGHIHVVDSKTYQVRYIRPGGTMNPANQPKSYVQNPQKPGFSAAFVDETKIVGVMGNLIRVYNYEVD